MLDFERSSQAGFEGFARDLWRNREQFPSHEGCSQHLTRSLYEQGIIDGEPSLALVRVYRLTDVKDLPAEARAVVSADDRSVMALTGTYGMEEAWCDRKQSVGHKAIPLSAIAIPNKIPMFYEVLRQMGAKKLADLRQTQDLLPLLTKPDGTFHIPDVPSSSAIPAQTNFVQPYGIKSLVGFGGAIKGQGSNTSLYLLYVFARVPISAEVAAQFNVMQPFIGTFLSMRPNEAIWS
jgi:hypothetical protein